METLGMRDIIGPVMVGPSSSHTAGALRIARMARNLLAGPPVKAQLVLYGSFAHTGEGHGTDKALVAGLLGMEADDLRIRTSFDIAREQGFDVSVSFDRATEPEHPNTVDICAVDALGTELSVRGVSVGGGAASIRRIDGIDVDVTGEHTSVVVRQDDSKGVLAHIAGCLSDFDVNIATTRLYRTRRGDIAYTVMETDDPIPHQAKEAIAAHAAVHEVRVIPAMSAAEGVAAEPAVDESLLAGERAVEAPAPVDAGACEPVRVTPEAADERFAELDFTTGAELLGRCASEGLSIGELFRQRENALRARDGLSPDADAYADRVLQVMRESATVPLSEPVASMGGLIGGEAQAVTTACAAGAANEPSSPAAVLPAVVDALTAKAMSYALAVLETNASMGRIVASPTAGSAGVLPAVLLALADERGFAREQLRGGVFTAAAVGYLVARNATVSGAEGGCQAEVGTACAMAAAAAVEMAGGAPAQALAAASNAFVSLMGLVCDPVGGLVEMPCQKRNATAAATALVCAQMALAGIANLVDFDETVAAMDAVGRTLPFELRESALGGIAAAPSACAHCGAC